MTAGRIHPPLPLDGATVATAAVPDSPAARSARAGQPVLIALHEATVQFGATLALSGLSLAIRRGERLALVGANGAGKTTLLRLLNGLQAPSRGERLLSPIARAGDAAAGARPRKPITAMLFQRPFLLHLSVRRNLALALWLAGVPGPERAARCADALARVGLQPLADQPARALSGGQQQRLALARAWAVQPDILFLDEPTASLDPTAKREVEQLIEDFGRSGMALVMSSHNLGQVKRLAERVLFLDRGRLLADRPVAEFFRADGDGLPPEAVQFLHAELPWR
ncbi:ABC transporter ATP-binding protein [Aquabacterium sp. OR-4]|uniref:ABC transporter ATP-binding protein n=1 Tax=Aquabacterium sp. OR-4 TaxID=2978127 RepID=UPI0021B41AFE|nr:phosphate ABC transporter ATP-binding protein [Aquabacterium sp. OR-4]MDT7837871.1 phosphate ABC transporter ATP-binding protein [Aquabacterium sp. OR-4]